MNISISYYSATGKRSNNEDSVSILESNRGTLAIVADGLGGHADGEVASRQAVTTMNQMLHNEMPDEDLLTDAVQQASREIARISDPARPMHTTVAALWVGNYDAITANVGDTRIYQFRDGKIVYQSLDHSVAQMAVLVGEMEQEEIRTSKDRNRLIRVLGDGTTPKVDCENLSVRQGDRFLLCSDGFWEAVTEGDMIATAAQTDTAQDWLAMMQRIVENVDNPGQDNHTAIALIIKAM